MARPGRLPLPHRAGRPGGVRRDRGHGRRTGGVLVLGSFAEDGPEACSGLPTARYSVTALGELFADWFEPEAGERERHVTPWGAEQSFSWVRLRRRRSAGSRSAASSPGRGLLEAEPAAGDLGAVPHRLQAPVSRHRRQPVRVHAHAVVGDRDLDPAVPAAHHDVDPVRLRVLAHVDQRLLDDPQGLRLLHVGQRHVVGAVEGPGQRLPRRCARPPRGSPPRRCCARPAARGRTAAGAGRRRRGPRCPGWPSPTARGRVRPPRAGAAAGRAAGRWRPAPAPSRRGGRPRCGPAPPPAPRPAGAAARCAGRPRAGAARRRRSRPGRRRRSPPPARAGRACPRRSRRPARSTATARRPADRPGAAAGSPRPRSRTSRRARATERSAASVWKSAV